MQQRHRQSPTLSFLLVLALLSTLVLAFLQSASAWPQNAGTVCSMTGSSLSDMTGSKHGSAKSGNGGFAVSTVATAQSDGSYQITLAGSSYRGLVLLARNDAGTLVGAFSGYPSGLSAKTDCDGPAGSILEHNVSERSGASNQNEHRGDAMCVLSSVLTPLLSFLSSPLERKHQILALDGQLDPGFERHGRFHNHF